MTLIKIVSWMLGAASVALAIWTASSAYIVWGIEQAQYEVLESRGEYEIRLYAPMLVAETEMNNEARRGEGDAFRVLASYIFGGNKQNRSIKMTAPVIRNLELPSQDIAMTAPVLIDDNSANSSMTFVVPSKFTQETIPVPNDPRVKLRTVPERTIAALSFGWQAPKSRRAKKVQELLSLLRRDGIEIAGTPVYAGFNPPFSVPFLKRHEIQVEISVSQ